MNKHEQIVMRVWNSQDNAECFRDKEHVLVCNGFSILLLNTMDRINPAWTYNSIPGHNYDRAMKLLDNHSMHKTLHLPTIAEIKEQLKGKNREQVVSIDLTTPQLDVNGRYTGCLTINLWYLYDFIWALGDNINAFWSGQVVSRKLCGTIRTHAKDGIYLAGSNGQAIIMPIEKKVD